MSPTLAECDAALLQQPPDLVDHRRTPNDPALSYPVQRLHIELVVGLDRNKAHGRSTDGFGNRFGVDKVALIRLYVGFHVLSRDDTHLMPLFSECSSQKMSPGTRFHADEIDLNIRGKLQQLCAGALPAHHGHATQI